jgi:hypothetical protein
MLNLYPFSRLRTVAQRRHDWMVRKVIREERQDDLRIVYGRKLIAYMERQRKDARVKAKKARRRNR